MQHLKISPKGRALMNNHSLCIAVVKAICNDDNEGLLYSKEGLKVIVGDKSITVRNATQIKSKLSKNSYLTKWTRRHEELNKIYWLDETEPEERTFSLKECPHCQISPVMCKCCGEILS